MITVKSNFHTWDHLVVCYSFFSTKLLDHHISYLRLLQPHQQANTCKFLKIRRKRQNIIFDKPLRKRDHLCADHFHFLKASAGSKSSWNYQWRKAKQWTKQICSSRNQNWITQRWVSEAAHWIFFHLVSCWWSCSWLYLEIHLLFSPLKRTPRFAQSQITL